MNACGVRDGLSWDMLASSRCNLVKYYEVLLTEHYSISVVLTINYNKKNLNFLIKYIHRFHRFGTFCIITSVHLHPLPYMWNCLCTDDITNF